MSGFSISGLSDAIRLALLADGREVRSEVIEKLLKDAAFDNQAELCAGDEFIPALSMYAIYADFTDRLGRNLGHETDPEGFALDWAGDRYPMLRRACDIISKVVLDEMRQLSDAFRQAHGYEPAEVVLKMAEHDTSPQIAAAILERERQQHNIH